MFGFSPKEWPKLDLSEIRKRSRIIVIDDLDFPYEILFKRDGYTIDKWSDIDDLNKLESGYYDLILLDLQGIGKEQSAEQGLGILKYLKKKNPAQIIIAYSDADWPIKYQDFFKLADTTLPKAADYVDFKGIVDTYLLKRFSISYYLSKINELVNSDSDAVPDIISLSKTAILNGSDGKIKKYLSNKIDNIETVESILKVICAAIEVGKICATIS